MSAATRNQEKKNVPALLRRRQLVLLPRHKHPNLAVRLSELSTIVNVSRGHVAFRPETAGDTPQRSDAVIHQLPSPLLAVGRL